ncbi:MAG TPA: transposase [Chitinophagaceae bacterium]|nr:transposase [Chitinophagaceae bacterium]
MTKGPGTQLRYSNGFKERVVRELEEEHLSIKDLQRRYGIRGNVTIQGWIRTFGKHHLLNRVVKIETMDEKDRIKELEKQIKELKLKLADSVMGEHILEEVIKEANRMYNTDLKKRLGQGSSDDSDKPTP